MHSSQQGLGHSQLDVHRLEHTHDPKANLGRFLASESLMRGGFGCNAFSIVLAGSTSEPPLSGHWRPLRCFAKPKQGGQHRAPESWVVSKFLDGSEVERRTVEWLPGCHRSEYPSYVRFGVCRMSNPPIKIPEE